MSGDELQLKAQLVAQLDAELRKNLRGFGYGR